MIESASLGEVATVISGQSPPGESYNEEGFGLPFFQGKADFTETYPTTRKWCTAPRKIAESGDILMSVRAPVGPTNIARERCCIGRGLAAIRPDESVALRDFIHWVLRSLEPKLSRKGQGSTLSAIGKKDILTLKIPLPSIDKQRRIADILNRAARIERLSVQAATDFRVFVSALFIKMFGDPIGNPMRWDRQRLGDISEVQGGLQVSKKRSVHHLEKPYLRVANVLRGQLFLKEIKRIRITDRELARVRLRRGDLLVVEGHGNATEIGRVAVWDGSVGDCVHQNHLIRVRPDYSLLNSEFTCAYLNSSSGREHLLRSGKTTSGLNTITTSDVRACPIFVPPLALQRRYSDIIERVREVTATMEFGSGTASALNASLMSDLLETPCDQIPCHSLSIGPG